MDSPHSLGQSQDTGLGGWHPAQRPNTDEASDLQTGGKAGFNALSRPDGDIATSPGITSSTFGLELPAQQSHANGSSANPNTSLEDTQEYTTEFSAADCMTSAGDSEDNLDGYQQHNGFLEEQDDVGARSVLHEQNVRGDPQHDPQMSPNGIEDETVAQDASFPLATSRGLSGKSLKPTGSMFREEPNSDDFAILGVSDRTNSFPDVPPVQTSKMPLHALPHSQAEDIMEEDEAENIMDFSAQEKGTFAKDSGDSAAQNPFGDHENDGVDDFYSRGANVQGGDMPTPPDDEARYEEGLPLVSPGSQDDEVSHSLEAEQETDAGILNDASTSGDDFFDNIAKPISDDHSFRPQALDRKTTSQVLGSMSYAPHDETHDGIDAANDRPAPTNLTGGDIAVSSSTVIEQILAEQRSDGVKTEGKDEDLAAMWQAALDDDELLDENPALDPSSLFEDDGEDFLASGDDQFQAQPASSPDLQPEYSPDGRMQGFTNPSTPGVLSGSSTFNRYTPNVLAGPQIQPPQAYGPQQSFAGPNQTFPPSRETSNDSFPAPDSFQGYSRQPLAYGNLSSSLRPQMPSSAQSFADKSKGGYTSPYDLPMDVAKPKKRNYTQQLRPGTGISTPANRPAPPPRSSSMFTSGAPVAAEAPPPVPSLPSSTRSLPGAPVTSSAPKPKTGAAGFFEDLPSAKPRQSTQSTRHAPPVQQSTGPTQISPQGPQSHQHTAPQAVAHLGSSSGALSPEQTYGLVPPARAGLYDNVPQQAPTKPAASNVNSRYSPAPPSQNHVPPARTRYAASPSGGPRAPPPQARPFQPRTSSPLAQAGPNSQHQQHNIDNRQIPSKNGQHLPFAEGYEQDVPVAAVHHSTISEVSQNNQTSPPPQSSRHGPLSSSSTPTYAINTPESDQPPSTSHSSGGQYQEQQVPENDHVGFAPPRRSQTQSPGAVRSQPSLPSRAKDVYQRPASVNERAVQKPLPAASTSNMYPNSGRARGFSQSMDYIIPTDGREHDPLERWKGCPIFRFGFGGTTVSTFPKQIPRYTSGRNKPKMKCSPGEVKVQALKALALDEDFKDFPGPLKSKNKKKEVLEWLHRRITQMEREYEVLTPSSVLPDPRKRHEEKILLWRILQILVEYDGVIEGKAPAEKAVRVILSPALAEVTTDSLPPSSNTQLLGITRSTGSSNIAEPTTPQDLESLRQILIQGDREKAVWHALDRRMWAHAMLISSTMEKNIWKQVLQEFIRQEVKSFGDNTESLAALYQIFAGNWEESVDELVPPSARAGLQFVSKAANAGPTRNALEGLDRWRETLTLALSNRSPEDGKAFEALGRLLSGYGRTEAAHICFIFAKSPSMFGGADEPSVNIALLGADHLNQSEDFGRDVDSILLTEIYDFACTVLAPSPSATVSPHLQAYKLCHAMLLAEFGYRSEAQQYCESITSALKLTTKRSPYYHDILFGKLEDLVGRLRQAPIDNSASWMSKPSLDKVGGSLFSKFNQFIAGDDSDADSAASAKGTNLAAGPFAGVSGGTPNASRPSSSGDIYGSYPAPQPFSGGGAAASRYAPSGQYAPQGQYTPRSSLEQNGRPSQEYRGPSQYEGLKPTNMHPQPSPTLSRQNSSANIYQQPPQQQARSSYQPQGYPTRSEGYLPTPPSHPEDMSEPPSEELSESLYEQEAYRPTPPLASQPMQSPQGQYEAGTGAPAYGQPSQTFAEPPPSYLPPASSYEPPIHESNYSASGFEPPSTNAYQLSSYGYDAYNAAPEVESPVEERSKKKSLMDDDDDDFVARAAAVLKQEKAQKDREADDAFRKAAEADGRFTLLMNLVFRH